jgi:hypothetical protein
MVARMALSYTTALQPFEIASRRSPVASPSTTWSIESFAPIATEFDPVNFVVEVREITTGQDNFTARLTLSSPLNKTQHHPNNSKTSLQTLANGASKDTPLTNGHRPLLHPRHHALQYTFMVWEPAAPDSMRNRKKG